MFAHSTWLIIIVLALAQPNQTILTDLTNGTVTIGDNSTLTVQEPVSEQQNESPRPTDLSLSISFLFIELAFVSVLALSKHARKYFLQGQPLGTVLRGHPYAGLDEARLERISNRIVTNLQIIIAVYGILLTFIVSNNLGLAFRSWTFTIWAGWILGIIVRAGMYARVISDVQELSSVEKSGSAIFKANQFYKHSLYLLILSFAFAPSFFFAPTDTQLNDWHNTVSVYSIAFSIGIGALLFFGLFTLVENHYTDNFIVAESLYLVPALVLGGVSLILVDSSPVTPETIAIFGTTFIVPSIAEILLTSMWSLLLGILISWCGVVSRLIIWNRKRRARATVSRKP